LGHRRGLCTVLKNSNSTKWVKRYSSTKSLNWFFSRTLNFTKVFFTGFSTVMILYFRICVMAHFRSLTVLIEEKASIQFFFKKPLIQFCQASNNSISWKRGLLYLSPVQYLKTSLIQNLANFFSLKFLNSFRPLCCWISPWLCIGSLPIKPKPTHTRPRPKPHPIACLFYLVGHVLYGFIKSLVLWKY